MSLDKIPRYSTFRAKFEGFSAGQSKKEVAKRGAKQQDRFKDRIKKTKQTLARKLVSEGLDVSEREVEEWAIKHILIEPESIIKFESLCVRCNLSTNLSLWQFQHCKEFLLRGFSGNWYKMLYHFHDIRPIMDKMTEFRLHVVETLIRELKMEFKDLEWIRVGDMSNEPGLPISIIFNDEIDAQKAVDVFNEKALAHLGRPSYVSIDVHVYTQHKVNEMEASLAEMNEGSQKFYQALLPGHSRKDLIAKLENLTGVVVSKKKDIADRRAAMARLLAILDPSTSIWNLFGTPVLYEITERLYTIASNDQLEDDFIKDAIGGLIMLCFRSEDTVVSFDAARRIYHLSKTPDPQTMEKIHSMALKALIQIAKQTENVHTQDLGIKELCYIIGNEEGRFPEHFRKEAKIVISGLIDGLGQDDVLLENSLARGLRYISNYGGELSTYWAKTKQSRVHENLTGTVSHFG